MSVALIWAASADGWIGRDGGLPWHLPEDLAHFREVTRGAPVVMGRTTWWSLPERFRPLPGRDNLVLSRDPALTLPGATVVGDPAAAVAAAGDRTLWVIGGAQVYAAFLPLADRLEVTDVDVVAAGDTPAPRPGAGWRTATSEPGAGWATSTTGLRYRFRTLVRTADDGGDAAG